MFYIVETLDQLQRLIDYKNDNVFIDVIPLDDRVHPALSTASLIYYRPLSAKRGFIISINHTEGFELDYTDVISMINITPQIYTIDKKGVLYHDFKESLVKGLKIAYTLTGAEFKDIGKFNTSAHLFYYRKLSSRNDVNRFIPISKHFEKYENFFNSVSFITEMFASKDYKFYNNLITNQLYSIEKNGLGVKDKDFIQAHNGIVPDRMIKTSKIYSSYNIYNHTARPTCKFQGINFLSFKKDSPEKRSIIPLNNVLVEFDYQAYQVKLLGDIIGWDFAGENPHEFLGKYYFNTDTLTAEQYKKAKIITFRYAYGRDESHGNIPFFEEVYKLRDLLWDMYRHRGFIKSPISGRKLTGIEEITQILPFLMQTYETERNMEVLEKVQELLAQKQSKLILYNYDAFLFDVSIKDGIILIDGIKNILQEGDYPVKIKYGYNYADMQELTD